MATGDNPVGASAHVVDGGSTPQVPASVWGLQGSPQLMEERPPWHTGEPVTPATPGHRFLASVVVAAIALSGWAIWRGVEEHTLSGTLLVVDEQFFDLRPGAPCSGENGYDDLTGGAQVVLVDDRGKTLSTGHLEEGQFDGYGCAFSFALEDVTRADFYGLTIGGGSRGEMQYSYGDLAAENWSVQLTIGDE